jgi:apolipoprotein N-acyltransferase
VSVGRTWRSDYYGKNLDVYLDLTRRALRAGSPRTIVWPEGAMSFFVESEPLYRQTITGLLEASGVELLVGGPHREDARGERVFNSVFAFSPDGRIEGRYDKQILVPFSETFPFWSSPLMRRRIDGAWTFQPGPPSPAPLETRLGRAGLLICNEAMFPELAAARARAGAEILISPSNDSWIAGEAFAEHMLAVVGLRAIEQRRYLVRASTSGPSAIIDPWGRSVARTTARTRHLLRGGVRPEQRLTPYARWGDAFGLACAGWVSAVLLGDLAMRRRLWQAGEESKI